MSVLLSVGVAVAPTLTLLSVVVCSDVAGVRHSIDCALRNALTQLMTTDELQESASLCKASVTSLAREPCNGQDDAASQRLRELIVGVLNQKGRRDASFISCLRTSWEQTLGDPGAGVEEFNPAAELAIRLNVRPFLLQLTLTSSDMYACG